MKIAITADVHLTSKKDHPERYNAFSDIFRHMKADGIEHLIVAGDLFDQSLKNYAEFEALCKMKKNQALRIHIIPGNHDPDLEASHFVSDNINVYSKPVLFKPDPSGFPILLLPYQQGCTMGEAMEEVASMVIPREWILVGHGDYTGGLKTHNPYEPGFYMPLTVKDVERYQPREVFLGHIHDSPDYPRVHYCGSPCGLDITETGRRHFLVYNSDEKIIEKVNVNVDRIFINESAVIVPMKDEIAFIRQAGETMIESWGLIEDELARVTLRLKVAGFCTDKAAVDKAIKEIFSSFDTWKDRGIDTSELSISDDLDRKLICERVRESIDKLKWPEGEDEPQKEEILAEALSLIYGG